MLPVDLHTECSNGIDPIWILNRYRDQMELKMPGFTGQTRSMISPGLGSQGYLSWNATTAEDDTLALLQTVIRAFAVKPNVVSFLEPHNEIDHRPMNILVEYGPAADVNYRKYLKEQYGDLEKLAARWHQTLKSWEEVRLPELVAFAGWGPQALDIGGIWRVGYEKLLPDPRDDGSTHGGREAAPSVPAPKEWFEPSFDDSAWPQVPGAGDDTQLFLQKHPSVFRREFTVPAGWIEKNPRVWLYEWDMNQATNHEVIVALNGQEVSRTKIAFITPHWSASEVTKLLKTGKNLVAIRVPQGRLEYKTYLSPVEPKQYPDLGEGLNAQWVDFSDFAQWVRVRTIKRSMEMIRQVAPNQGITLMHPDDYSDAMKALAVAYGGEFHNTGYMGGFWADWNTSIMRGADLPYSVEPGGPASDLKGWKHQWGLWQTEGCQAVDYFISMGSIIFNPEIKADYELHRKQISLMGQSHYPKAETAVLYSDRTFSLTTYPWESGNDSVLAGGYFKWNVGSVLRGQVPYDGLSQSSFRNSEADAYRVVVDSNTTIMDPSMVSEIETWVRNGGTFVTIAQTGRHTPEVANSWPISRLTGYKVTRIDRITPGGEIAESGTLKPAPDQDIYGAGWNGMNANGLHLEKSASETQNLLLWNDGTVAAGYRPLGKGYIVELGCKFTATGISDRIEPKGENDETRHLRGLVMAVLNWRKVAPEPAHLTVDNPEVLFRHGVTNNGVYDTWTMWNQSENIPQSVSLEFTDKEIPAFSIDMRGDEHTPSTKDVLQNITIAPLETRVFLTPRDAVEQAPEAWFKLQRGWWRGTTPPDPTPFTVPAPRLTRDLCADWKFHAIDAKTNAEPFSAVNFDDKDWASRSIGLWDVKEEGGAGHAIFRRTFTVPQEWNNGRVSMWVTSWFDTPFLDKGRIWLDGKEVKSLGDSSYVAEGMASLSPGSTHVMAIEVQSGGVVAGLRGACWISFEPTPPEKIDLSGEWSPSADGLVWGAPIKLPGHFKGRFFKRSVFVDAKYKGHTGVITIDGERGLTGVLINGKLMMRTGRAIVERGSLNLAPYLRFGENNEIVLIHWNGVGEGNVRDVFIGMFDQEPF